MFHGEVQTMGLVIVPSLRMLRGAHERRCGPPHAKQEEKLTNRAELLVLHWHLHDRGGGLVLRVFL